MACPHPLLPAHAQRPWVQAAQRIGCMVALGLICVLAAGCDANVPASDVKPSADVQRGQRLLTQYQCGSCHAIPGIAAARGTLGPNLEAFGKRSYIAGRIPNRPDALVRWIVSPAALVPDTAMPSMGVSVHEARDMAAYLGALQ